MEIKYILRKITNTHIFTTGYTILAAAAGFNHAGAFSPTTSTPTQNKAAEANYLVSLPEADSKIIPITGGQTRQPQIDWDGDETLMKQADRLALLKTATQTNAAKAIIVEMSKPL